MRRQAMEERAQIREVIDRVFANYGKCYKSKITGVATTLSDIQSYSEEEDMWIESTCTNTDEETGQEINAVLDGIIRFAGKYYAFYVIIDLDKSESGQEILDFCKEDIESDNSIIKTLVSANIQTYRNRSLAHRFCITREDEEGGWGRMVTGDPEDDGPMPMTQKTTKDDVYSFFERFMKFRASRGSFGKPTIEYSDGSIIIRCGGEFGAYAKVYKFKVEEYIEKRDLGRR